MECGQRAPEVPASAIERLSNLVDIVKGDDNDATVTAWSAIQDPDTMDSLSIEWNRDSGRVGAILAAIEAVPGNAMRARNLRSAIRRLAEDRARETSARIIDELEQELEGVSSLSEQLGPACPSAELVDPAVLETLRVPPGYQIDAAGVHRLAATPDGELRRTRIAAAPIFIVRRTVDVDTGEAKRQVVWRGAGGWTSRIVSRRTILDSRQILCLSDLEAPISSANIVQIVSFLADFEAENSHRFPSVVSTSKMGWMRDGSFMLPNRHITHNADASPHVLAAPTGLDNVAKGWVEGGTWEGWLEAVEEIKHYPYMMISIYAAAAAPLLQVLSMPGFVVDFSGETSGGKTTALRLAASVWGQSTVNYPTTMYSWDATKVWIERTAGFLCNLPLILDETKRARHPRMIRDVIYDFCQGQGRGRGSIEGTQATTSWRTILISSGEGAATSFSEDAGTRARVLSLEGKPLGHDVVAGGRVSETVQYAVNDHYGHLGRRMIEYLVGNHDNLEQLQDVFEELRQHYADHAESAVGRRHSAHLALLDLTSRIIHSFGVPRSETDPFLFLVGAASAAADEADRPLAAMADVYSWCTANQARFYGRHEVGRDGRTVKTPTMGWVGTWGDGNDWDMIGILPSVLKRLLKDMGHHPTEVIRRWGDRGWLRKGNGRNLTRPVRIDGAVSRCYIIDREGVALLEL